MNSEELNKVYNEYILKRIVFEDEIESMIKREINPINVDVHVDNFEVKINSSDKLNCELIKHIEDRFKLKFSNCSSIKTHKLIKNKLIPRQNYKEYIFKY